MDQSSKKMQQIEEQLERIDERLENAREYVANNVNVRGTSRLHFGDWKGKSGHPLWMKNVMIPRTLKGRGRKEIALRTIETKVKDKHVSLRKRRRVRGNSVIREFGPFDSAVIE
jgi:hypothetical protein